MFQFRGFPPYSYGFTIRRQGIALPGFPIRKSAGQWIFAPNRSLSQLVTSFIGSWCQVILPTLFLTWPLFGSRKLHKNKRVFEIEVLPKISKYFGKTFPQDFVSFRLQGFVIRFRIFFLLSLLSIIFLMLHYLVFKVQLFEYDVLFWTIRKNASVGISTNIP